MCRVYSCIRVYSLVRVRVITMWTIGQRCHCTRHARDCHRAFASRHRGVSLFCVWVCGLLLCCLYSTVLSTLSVVSTLYSTLHSPLSAPRLLWTAVDRGWKERGSCGGCVSPCGSLWFPVLPLHSPCPCPCPCPFECEWAILTTTIPQYHNIKSLYQFQLKFHHHPISNPPKHITIRNGSIC